MDPSNNGINVVSSATSTIQLGKNFSRISLLGLAFAILNSWTAFASALPLSLTSGGPTSIVWGLLGAWICTQCIAISLAEFLSAYPMAAGQYHWVAVAWENSFRAILSWYTGWFNVTGWVFLMATASLFGSSLIMNVVVMMSPRYDPQRWEVFLVYIGFCLVAFFVNAFWNSILPAINKAALIWSLCGFVVVSVTVLACASPGFNSARFVFTEFINQTGWPDGLAWLLGLLQGGLCLTGFDAVAHMIEEIPNPSVEGPRVMVACVGIGAFTSSVFIIVLLFVCHNIDTIISSPYGPLLQILLDATSSPVGATCLILFPIICLLLGVVAIMTTCSRMIYALSRDFALPFSKTWTKIHPVLGTPLNALLVTTSLAILCGCIYLGSSSAFNALSSATVICFDISYGLPILIHCLRGRKMLRSSPWKLHPTLGWIVNLVSIAYISLTTVLFLFPPFILVTGDNMNYCIAAVSVVVVISTGYWFFEGRHKFTRLSDNADQDHAIHTASFTTDK